MSAHTGGPNVVATKALRVGDLRRALDGVDDNLTIIVEMYDEDDQFVQGSLTMADVEQRCADTPSLFLFGDRDVVDGGEEAEEAGELSAKEFAAQQLR